jgi:S1-C subfamily serine protease
MVLGIDPQSPMAGKGLHGGTIITSVAGKPVGSVVDLQQILNDTPADQCAVATLPTAADAVVSGQ